MRLSLSMRIRLSCDCDCYSNCRTQAVTPSSWDSQILQCRWQSDAASQQVPARSEAPSQKNLLRGADRLDRSPSSLARRSVANCPELLCPHWICERPHLTDCVHELRAHVRCTARHLDRAIPGRVVDRGAVDNAGTREHDEGAAFTVTYLHLDASRSRCIGSEVQLWPAR